MFRDQAQEKESTHSAEKDSIKMTAAKEKTKVMAKLNAMSKELKSKLC